MASKMYRIFAFGGNEVAPIGITDKEGRSINPDIPTQWQRTVQTCEEIAGIMEKNPDDNYIITHGNGPQVGNILLRAEYSLKILHNIPLDVCGADSQGGMGYMIAQLGNVLRSRGINKTVAETVTQVVVSRDDPAFQDPTKFIGPPYSEVDALERSEKFGWKVRLYKKDDRGNEIWRRVVPSPVPIDIVEIDILEACLEKGIIPISVGGGGIPVVEVEPEIEDGMEVYRCNYDIVFKRPYEEGKGCEPKPKIKIYTGVEAVIDKDYASSLLGRLLIQRAKSRGEGLRTQDIEVELTIFTSEDGAKLNYQQPDEKNLRLVKLSELKELYNQDPCPFPPGSMGPKVKAIIDFLEGGGSKAYISLTKKFAETLKGEAGTTVVKD